MILPQYLVGDTTALTCSAIAGVLVCDEPEDMRLKPCWCSLEDPFNESRRMEPVTIDSRHAVLRSIAQDIGKLAAENYKDDNSFQDFAQRALHLAWMADELEGSTFNSESLLEFKYNDGGDMFQPFSLRKRKDGECLFNLVVKRVHDQKDRQVSFHHVTLQKSV